MFDLCPQHRPPISSHLPLRKETLGVSSVTAGWVSEFPRLALSVGFSLGWVMKRHWQEIRGQKGGRSQDISTSSSWPWTVAMALAVSPSPLGAPASPRTSQSWTLVTPHPSFAPYPGGGSGLLLLLIWGLPPIFSLAFQTSYHLHN